MRAVVSAIHFHLHGRSVSSMARIDAFILDRGDPGGMIAR
jgi:hypothetical protein